MRYLRTSKDLPAALSCHFSIVSHMCVLNRGEFLGSAFPRSYHCSAGFCTSRLPLQHFYTFQMNIQTCSEQQQQNLLIATGKRYGSAHRGSTSAVRIAQESCGETSSTSESTLAAKQVRKTLHHIVRIIVALLFDHVSYQIKASR